MREAGFLDAIGTFYDAASGAAPWDTAGEALRRSFGANTASLHLRGPGGVDVLFALGGLDESAAAYAAHYHRLDPWVRGFASVGIAAPGRPAARLGYEVVPEAEYRRSEFYQDFARHFGLFHVVGTVLALGEGGAAPLGLHRPERGAPFGEAERRALDALLPHLGRALQLYRRLQDATAGPRAAAAALDALPVAVVVVDAEMRVVHANAAAERLAMAGDALRILRAGPAPGADLVLSAAHRADAAALAALVRGVALRGAPGGGLRLARRASEADGAGAAGPAATALAVLVAPLPACLTRRLTSAVAAREGGVMPGRALVLARDLSVPPTPAPGLLMDLFSLTAAEAEVAVALAGGATAESVATTRGVGTATVRWQVRSVLEKTGAANLRDLERMLASLPGV